MNTIRWLNWLCIYIPHQHPSHTVFLSRPGFPSFSLPPETCWRSSSHPDRWLGIEDSGDVFSLLLSSLLLPSSCFHFTAFGRTLANNSSIALLIVRFIHICPSFLQYSALECVVHDIHWYILFQLRTIMVQPFVKTMPIFPQLSFKNKNKSENQINQGERIPCASNQVIAIYTFFTGSTCP